MKMQLIPSVMTVLIAFFSMTPVFGEPNEKQLVSPFEEDGKTNQTNHSFLNFFRDHTLKNSRFLQVANSDVDSTYPLCVIDERSYALPDHHSDYDDGNIKYATNEFNVELGSSDLFLSKVVGALRRLQVIWPDIEEHSLLGIGVAEAKDFKDIILTYGESLYQYVFAFPLAYSSVYTEENNVDPEHILAQEAKDEILLLAKQIELSNKNMMESFEDSKRIFPEAEVLDEEMSALQRMSRAFADFTNLFDMMTSRDFHRLRMIYEEDFR